MHEQSRNHISLIKQAYDVMQSHPLHRTHFHQLRWGDREMGTAISCTECSQVAGLIQKLVETPQKHRLFVQLFFVQLSFIQRSCVAIVIIDHHVLSVHEHVHACAPIQRLWM